MPVPSPKSPVTGDDCSSHFIHADSEHFRDVHGRVLLLRGVNLAGSAKNPVNQPLEKRQGFWESAESGEVSFVGRTLDVENGDADVHLSRLRSWGFNCIRYVTTWEAIEHTGPGKYDVEYFEYTVKVLRKCKEYGFKVVMDPHQDLFSRFSGGSGAPFWSLEACGLNPRNFTATCASVLECEWDDPADFPSMIWATNYNRLAAQTLCTLFFSGRKYAPKCVIDGKNIQDWLQDHFIASYKALAEYIRDAGDLLDICVIGWDSINEPNPGYLSMEDLSEKNDDTPLKIGPTPTGIQSFRLGVGETVTVDTYKFGPFGSQRNGTQTIRPEGRKAWLDPDSEAHGSSWGWRRDPNWRLGECIWAQHGVWDPSTGDLLQPEYFRKSNNTDSDFVVHHWLPHYFKWAEMIRKVHRESILFIHPPVFKEPPDLKRESGFSNLLKSRAAMSVHFYDGLTMVSRKWNWYNFDALGYIRGKYWSVLSAIRIGERAIRKCLREQLETLKEDTSQSLGNYPTFIGEIGVPYDLDNKKAYEDGDYSSQIRAWDASLNSLDGENTLNCALWSYSVDNSHKWGDHYNGEDFSLWSKDDVKPDAMLVPPPSLSSHAPCSNDLSSTSSTTVNSATSMNKRGVGGKDHDNGGRALAAICRPYPIAIVGKPLYYEFDISTSTFTLKVQVSSDDVDMEDLSTEIYVPRLHYREAFEGESEGEESSTEEERDEVVTPTLRSSQGRDMPANFNVGDRKFLNDMENTESDGMALCVKVSAGRWEIDEERQILRWDYKKPQHGERTQHITITRANGSLYANGGIECDPHKGSTEFLRMRSRQHVFNSLRAVVGSSAMLAVCIFLWKYR